MPPPRRCATNRTGSSSLTGTTCHSSAAEFEKSLMFGVFSRRVPGSAYVASPFAKPEEEVALRSFLDCQSARTAEGDSGIRAATEFLGPPYEVLDLRRIRRVGQEHKWQMLLFGTHGQGSSEHLGFFHECLDRLVQSPRNGHGQPSPLGRNLTQAPSGFPSRR